MMQAIKELINDYSEIFELESHEEKVAFTFAVIIATVSTSFMSYVFLTTHSNILAVVHPPIFFLIVLEIVYYLTFCGIIAVELLIDWLHGEEC